MKICDMPAVIVNVISKSPDDVSYRVPTSFNYIKLEHG